VDKRMPWEWQCCSRSRDVLQMKISLVVNRSLQQEQCQVIVAAKFNPASWRFTAQCNCSRNTRSIFIISNTNDRQLVAFIDQPTELRNSVVVTQSNR